MQSIENLKIRLKNSAGTSEHRIKTTELESFLKDVSVLEKTVSSQKDEILFLKQVLTELEKKPSKINEVNVTGGTFK